MASEQIKAGQAESPLAGATGSGGEPGFAFRLKKVEIAPYDLL